MAPISHLTQGFIRIAESLADDPVMALLYAEVDRGEAAAIALARRLNGPSLILDDLAGMTWRAGASRNAWG
jgi:predicted nucleic acid-binding protein